MERLVLERGKVTGVTLSDGSVVHATKEVILAGGAINTPQLLLLSGIGPRRELDAHGIEVQHSLPGVGKNLQDHLAVLVQQ